MSRDGITDVILDLGVLIYLFGIGGGETMTVVILLPALSPRPQPSAPALCPGCASALARASGTVMNLGLEETGMLRVSVHRTLDN